MRPALPLLAAALASCSFVQNPSLGPEAEAWAAARQRFTRSARFYDRLESHSTGSATWQAPEVRRSRAEQVAAWRAMTSEERQALVAAEEAEAARWDEFLLALYTTDAKANDLDAPRSSWRVALVRPEGEKLPAEVRSLPATPELRALYPAIRDHDLVYRIRFARSSSAGEGPFTLRIAGSEGRLDFAFP